MGPWRVYIAVTWSISLNESVSTFNWTLFFNIYHFFIEGKQQKLSKLPGNKAGILNCIFWNRSNGLLYGERTSKSISKLIEMIATGFRFHLWKRLGPQVLLQGLGSWISDLGFRTPSLAFWVPTLRINLGIGSLARPKVPGLRSHLLDMSFW